MGMGKNRELKQVEVAVFASLDLADLFDQLDETLPH